ncbi:unnamed protein product [Boreogadus saida]
MKLVARHETRSLATRSPRQQLGLLSSNDKTVAIKSQRTVLIRGFFDTTPPVEVSGSNAEGQLRLPGVSLAETAVFRAVASLLRR